MHAVPVTIEIYQNEARVVAHFENGIVSVVVADVVEERAATLVQRRLVDAVPVTDAAGHHQAVVIAYLNYVVLVIVVAEALVIVTSALAMRRLESPKPKTYTVRRQRGARRIDLDRHHIAHVVEITVVLRVVANASPSVFERQWTEVDPVSETHSVGLERTRRARWTRRSLFAYIVEVAELVFDVALVPAARNVVVE